MNTLKEDLLKVRAKIEKGWCQGSLARDADQHPVDVRAPEAVTFCVVGAVDSTIVLNCVVLNALWKTLNAEKYVGGLAQFNDAGNMTDVIAALATLANLDRPEREAALAGAPARAASGVIVQAGPGHRR